MIVGHLQYASDVKSLSQTCRQLHAFGNERLSSFFLERYSPRGFNKVIKSGNLAALRKLASSPKFSLEPYTSSYESPEITAADFGHLEMLKVLLDKMLSTANIFQLMAKAINKDHLHILNYILGLGLPIKTLVHGYDGACLLSFAAEHGTLSAVKLLVDAGFHVDSCDRDNRSPLWWAAKRGSTDIVKFLIETGANPMIAGTARSGILLLQSGSLTPLYCAACGNHEDVVRFLLARSAHPPLEEDPNPRVLAEIAVQLETREPIWTMIFEHIDLNKLVDNTNLDGRELLLVCAVKSGDIQLARRILDSVQADFPCVGYTCALELAIKYDNTRMFRLLWPHRPNDGRGLYGSEEILKTVIRTSARHRRERILTTVIQDLGSQASSQFSLSAMYPCWDCPRMTDFILRRGVLGKITDRSLFWGLLCSGLLSNNHKLVQAVLDQLGGGFLDKIVPLDKTISPSSAKKGPEAFCTVLEVTAVWGDGESFRWALSRGGVPAPTDPIWARALAYATQARQADTMQIMLDRGLDVNALYETANQHLEPLLVIIASETTMLDDLAFNSPDYVAALKVVLDHGAKVDATGTRGVTALAYAVQTMDRPLIKELLRHGANPLAGHPTPLHVACRMLDSEVVELFLEQIRKQKRHSSEGTPDDTFGVVLGQCFYLLDKKSKVLAQLKKGTDEENEESILELDTQGANFIDEAELSDLIWEDQDDDEPLADKEWEIFNVRKSLQQEYWRMKYPPPEA